MFGIALIFTLIGLVESGFRIANLLSGGLIAARLTPDLELGIRSWTVHHAMRPGWVNPASPTNSFGLRSPEVAVPKPAGTFRILSLGDSRTFGWGLADEATYSRRLERLLSELPKLNREPRTSLGGVGQPPGPEANLEHPMTEPLTPALSPDTRAG